MNRLRETPRWLDWVGSHPVRFLAVLAFLAGGVLLFLLLAGVAMGEGNPPVDQMLLLLFRNSGNPADPLGPAWVEELARDVTALGSMAVLALITLAVAGYLLLEHKHRACLLLAAATGGGALASSLLKDLFDRARPELVPHQMEVFTTSFPSGHSMLSATTYLTLAALLARLQERRRTKAYLFVAALAVSLAVGISRVYLGVHWPTDVLAGWTAGAVWALLCWEVARWLQHRGRIESPGG